MAVIRSVNLNAPQSFAPGAVDLGATSALDPRVAALLQAKQQQGQQSQPQGNDRMYAMAQALSQTPRVQGTSPVEAIAAALTGGLRGIQANREHQDELKQTARQNDLADALQQHQMEGWKQQAQDRTQTEATRAAHEQALASLPEELRPYALLGIEGPITQYARHQWPTPQRPRAGSGGAPDLPSGFTWE